MMKKIIIPMFALLMSIVGHAAFSQFCVYYDMSTKQYIND